MANSLQGITSSFDIISIHTWFQFRRPRRLDKKEIAACSSVVLVSSIFDLLIAALQGQPIEIKVRRP